MRLLAEDQRRLGRHRHLFGETADFQYEVDLEDLPELQSCVGDFFRGESGECGGEFVEAGRQRRESVFAPRIRDRGVHADDGRTARFNRDTRHDRTRRVSGDAVNNARLLLRGRR